MVTINLRGYKGNIDDIEKHFDADFCENVIKSICSAIDIGTPKIIIARILTDAEDIFLMASERYFKNTMECYLPTLIRFERYEVCAMAKKYISIIEKNNLEYTG